MFSHLAQSIKFLRVPVRSKIDIRSVIIRRLAVSSNLMERKIMQSIKLNETEDSIRKVLIEFCEHYNKSQEKSEEGDLELRITGGWVRDKLLGIESNDLDIAVNHLSGEEFASRLLKYLNTNHPEMNLKGTHTIKKNPEKSKHLETCTTKLFGLDIDFVNLRSEKYTLDSRIPIIECGTPEEDALRRDATLNALFYNIGKDEIEDFTQKGLLDLEKGILRTPLSPWQTFLDDPLRVLRLIRFASKYNFEIEKETLNAMMTDEIKVALIHKISRERIGIEIEKTLTSANPQYGLELISYVGLTRSIFDLSVYNDEIQKLNEASAIEECNSIYNKLETHIPRFTALTHQFEEILTSSNCTALTDIYKGVINDKLSRKQFFLACSLLPFGSFSLKFHPKKPTTLHVPEVLLKEGLRLGKADASAVSSIIKETILSRSTLEQIVQDIPDVKRSALAFYIRKFGDNFNLNVVCNCLNDILLQLDGSPATQHDTPHLPSATHPVLTTAGPVRDTILQSISKYESLLQSIQTQQLQNAHEVKPLVDGKTLSTRLNLKPGPWMGKINSEILLWQFDHPAASNEDCLAYARSIVDSFL